MIQRRCNTPKPNPEIISFIIDDVQIESSENLQIENRNQDGKNNKRATLLEKT